MQQLNAWPPRPIAAAFPFTLYLAQPTGDYLDISPRDPPARVPAHGVLAIAAAWDLGIAKATWRV